MFDPKRPRDKAALDNFKQLFKANANEFKSNDPELMEILQKYIFGDIFSIGDLTIKEREMITVVCLASIQCLPQLKAHLNAALNVGNTPLELREALYTCFNFLGFPRTLNALDIFNTVMKDRKINLPLESGKTIKDEERLNKGLEIQKPLFGDALNKMLANVPGGIGDKMAQLITETYFGDTYSRKFLDQKTREMINVITLVALGNYQILKPHLATAIKLGNSKEKMAAVLLQCAPYVGGANAISAMLVLSEIAQAEKK